VSEYKPKHPYNRVHRMPLTVEWRRFPRLARYEATAYNSGYGIGFVTAYTRRGCDRKLDRLIGKMTASDW
jgi:hypothetical protein